MTKNMICIECPVSCVLSIDIENCRVVKIKGNKCPKGEEYAVLEVENPARILTSVVLAEGISLKMIPVKTDRPIPKARLMDAMLEIKNIRINNPLRAGDIVVKNFLGTGANLVATRDAPGVA